MFSRQALRPMLASAATLLVTALASAQTPPSAQKSAPTVQILPVSLTNQNVAATINGEKILVGEVKKILDQRPYPVALSEEQKKQLRHAALDVLIEDVVMRQYLSKNVPQVSQEEFNKEWTEFQTALQKKEGKTLKQFLDESSQTEDQVRRDVISRLQWKTLLTRYYPDDAKLKAYYDANKPFFDKTFVRASHILIKLDAKSSKEQRDQAAQQMLVWRNDILTGKTKFEDVAKLYSQCPSKDKGGDIGDFPFKFVVVPEFAKTAFSMKKGEISGVVTTPFGLHLILVTGVTPGEASNFATAKDAVREAMAQDDDLYTRALADQRKSSDIKIDLP